MSEALARSPRRILVRGSKFKIGQEVQVNGDASGDYIGVVTERHMALTKSVSAYIDRQETKPGVTIRVQTWGGFDVSGDRMDIEAWDEEASLV